MVRTFIFDWFEPYEVRDPLVIAAEGWGQALDKAAARYAGEMGEDTLRNSVYRVTSFAGDVTALVDANRVVVLA